MRRAEQRRESLANVGCLGTVLEGLGRGLAWPLLIIVRWVRRRWFREVVISELER